MRTIAAAVLCAGGLAPAGARCSAAQLWCAQPSENEHGDPSSISVRPHFFTVFRTEKGVSKVKDSISENVDENQPPKESRQMVAAPLVRIETGSRNAHDVEEICQSVLQMSLCR